MKRCKECGQEIKKKNYYIGDILPGALGAVLLDKRESLERVGQIILAIVRDHRVFYVWYFNENNEFEEGNYFLTITQAIENYEARR